MADLSCSYCIPQNDTELEIERSRKKREELGCTKETSYPIFTDDNGEDYYRCPVRSVSQDAWFLLDLYGFYEQGHLPVDGGIMKQPAILMNCFSIIRSQRIKEERED